ncbi:MAG: AI-2E family transporter [Nitrospirota bacterium]
MLHTAKSILRPDQDSLKPVVDRHLWEMTPVKDVFYIGSAILLAWSIYELSGIFLPVFVALVLAYLANPVIRYTERKWGWPRPLSAALFLLLFIGLAAGAVLGLGPLVAEQFHMLIQNIPKYEDWFTTRLSWKGSLATQFKPLLSSTIQDPFALFKPLFAGTGQAFGILGVMVGATMNAALLLFLLPVYFFFFAWNCDRIFPALIRFFPRTHRENVVHVLQRMDAAVSGYFRERLLIAIVTGIMYAGAWAAAGVPYWFLLGIGTGLLTLVPYISVIGWPVAILFKYLESLTTSGMSADWMAIFLWPSVAYLVVQFIESWILTPWIQRRSSDMSVVSLIIVLFIGGAIAGIFGMIFAIPIAACIKIAVEELVLPRWTAWAARH